MRIFRHAVRWVPVLLLVAGVGWLWANRLDVGSIPQKEFYREATVSNVATMTAFPKQHKVVIQPVADDRLPGIVASYLPPPLGSGGQSEMQGFYEPKDGHIEITGGLARLSAAMPVDILRSLFYRDLRHEYGHAFLHDWMKATGAGDRAWAATLQDAKHIDPASVPAQLRDSVSEYRALNPSEYGLPYFTSNFSEYMAESYARLLSGLEVPPKTEKFLRTVGCP